MADDSNKGLGSSKIDPQTKHDIQSKGGQTSSSQQDMSKLGQKGGQVSGENIKNDSDRAAEAGHMSSGNRGNHEEHVKAGEQSHKNDK